MQSVKKQVKFIFLISILFTFSCVEKSKIPNTWYQNASKLIVDKWIGKEMTLPNNLGLINSLSNNKKTSDIFNVPYKIVVHIDGNCSVCINSILFWQKFSSKLKSHRISCEIILFIEVDYKDGFKETIDKLNVNLPCLYDKEAKFKSANDLYDPRFEAALLDKDNKVIIIGNPVLNETLGDLYFDTLKDLKEK